MQRPSERRPEVIGAGALLISAAILFYVIRYRVHVHVTYTAPAGRRPRHHRSPKPASGSAIARTVEPTRSTAAKSSEASSLISSALVNLGAKPRDARAAAERAIQANPAAPFETLLRKAIQEY